MEEGFVHGVEGISWVALIINHLEVHVPVTVTRDDELGVSGSLLEFRLVNQNVVSSIELLHEETHVSVCLSLSIKELLGAILQTCKHELEAWVLVLSIHGLVHETRVDLIDGESEWFVVVLWVGEFHETISLESVLIRHESILILLIEEADCSDVEELNVVFE